MSASIQRETPILCLAYEKIEGKKKTNNNNKRFHFYAISYVLLPRTKKKKTQRK